MDFHEAVMFRCINITRLLSANYIIFLNAGPATLFLCQYSRNILQASNGINILDETVLDKVSHQIVNNIDVVYG